jgi:hypothetical protein
MHGRCCDLWVFVVLKWRWFERAERWRYCGCGEIFIWWQLCVAKISAKSEENEGSGEEIGRRYFKVGHLSE